MGVSLTVLFQLRSFQLVVLLLFPLLGGCQRDDSAVPVVAWTLLAGGEATQVTLPTHMSDRVTDRAQTFHLTASVAVPAPLRDRPLTLVIPHLWAPVSLSVRGREMASLEPVDDPTRRPLGHHAFVVPASETGSAALPLDLAVTHSWTQSAWLDTVPYLTAAPFGGARYSVIRGISTFENLVGIGSILTVTLVYGIVFLLDRRRTAQGWFAAQGLAASLYCFFVSSRTESWLGSYDAPATLFGLCCAIFVSIRALNNDVVLRDENISKLHAWLEKDDDASFHVSDSPFALLAEGYRRQASGYS